MADATIASGPWRNSVPIRLMGTDSDNLVEETGIATWGAGNAAEELPLSYIGEVMHADFTWIKATGVNAADGVMSTDGVITSGKITVARAATNEGAISYYYRILGKPVLTT